MDYPPVVWHIELDKPRRHEDDRRGVGRRRPVPGRLFPGLPLVGVERPLPRRRPAVRQGRPGLVGTVATRIAGSADIYGRRRAPINSVNFITSHDGFTLNDLVSYNGKHNEANGEGNRDGNDDNLSWNCGVEGETDDPEIEALGARQIQNFPTILLLSQGVPMIVVGDEARRTQTATTTPTARTTRSAGSTGSASSEHADLFRFFSELIAFRKEHPMLRRGASSPASSTSAAWPTSRGTAAAHAPGWETPLARARVHPRRASRYGPPAGRADTDLHVMMNMDWRASTSTSRGRRLALVPRDRHGRASRPTTSQPGARAAFEGERAPSRTEASWCSSRSRDAVTRPKPGSIERGGSGHGGENGVNAGKGEGRAKPRTRWRSRSPTRSPATSSATTGTPIVHARTTDGREFTVELTDTTDA